MISITKRVEKNRLCQEYKLYKKNINKKKKNVFVLISFYVYYCSTVDPNQLNRINNNKARKIEFDLKKKKVKANIFSETFGGVVFG